ncbi:DUF1653 domain-containing protein [Nostoc sp. CHAB 5834]|nr:DUF1653 domain-containing protein [Nostoc sp. CHAB 5834]
MWSRPYDEFFSDVAVNGEFVPRFRQLPQ